MVQRENPNGVPTEDEIAVAAVREVVIAGKTYPIAPPRVREVRKYRIELEKLDFRIIAASKALRAEPDNADLFEAVQAADNALVEYTLRLVPEIAADWERILDAEAEGVEEEMLHAFWCIYWWYLDPLQRGLAAKKRAARLTMIRKAGEGPSVTPSSPTG